MRHLTWWTCLDMQSSHNDGNHFQGNLITRNFRLRSTNSFPSYCITIVKSIEYCQHKNLFLDFENALPSKLHFPILSWMNDHSFDSISISTTQHLDLSLYSNVVTFESSNETLLVAYNRDRRLKRECWRVQNDMCVSNKSFH